MIHPWHLHGMGMLVYSQDGYPLPQPYMCHTLNIAPGQRFDVFVDCANPGTWAFHCHILTDAEAPKGMFGMVTALVIKKERGAPNRKIPRRHSTRIRRSTIANVRWRKRFYL